MFYTMNYRHGWINSATYPGSPETFRAQVPGYSDLGEFRSMHAAKLAITRDAKTRAADRAQHAAEHHRFIQNEIWGRK